jgi:hypothetical protein
VTGVKKERKIETTGFLEGWMDGWMDRQRDGWIDR